MADHYYEGERIYFRTIEPADAPILRRWFNDPQTRATLVRALPMSDAGEKDWIDKLYTDGGTVAFVIVLREGDRPIGSIGLKDIHPVHRTATFGIMIGEPECRGRGYGTEATRLLLKYAFEELNLNRIELGVLATNSAGVRAYERAGFVREGCARQAYFRAGRYVDELRYAALREDWVMRQPLPGNNGRSLVARYVMPVQGEPELARVG